MRRTAPDRRIANTDVRQCHADDNSQRNSLHVGYDKRPSTESAPCEPDPRTSRVLDSDAVDVCRKRPHPSNRLDPLLQQHDVNEKRMVHIGSDYPVGKDGCGTHLRAAQHVAFVELKWKDTRCCPVRCGLCGTKSYECEISLRNVAISIDIIVPDRCSSLSRPWYKALG